MNKLEDLLKQAFTTKKWVVNPRFGKCLDDVAIACVVENKISKREEDKISNHIVHCRSCTEKLSAYLLTARDIAKEGEVGVPSFLIERVQNLVAQKATMSDVLDIILEIKEKALELIQTTGDLLLGSQPALALRSKDESESKNSIHVMKSFDNFNADVEIDKRVSNSTDLILRLTEKESNKRAEDIRVSLLRNNREIESQILQGGKAKFEDIRPDIYKVVLMKDDKEIGIINVTMRVK